jgi:signal transduction histidine kinase
VNESVLLVQTPPSIYPLLNSNLSQFYKVIQLESSDVAINFLKDEKENIASIVLGSNIKDPIQTSQRLHAFDKSLSIIILTNQENLNPLRKSISFTPFLGNLTSCLADSNADALIPEIKKMVEGTIKYRETKKLSANLNLQLSSIGAKKNSNRTSKEYIEGLFDAAPIGIITVDNTGQLLALNKASSQMVAISEQQSIGTNIHNIFPDFLLVPDRKEEVSKEVKGETRFFEITINSISGKDLTPGHLILLVDITERKNHEIALSQAIRARDEFLSIASHELRTPVTSLKLQLQMAVRSVNSKDLESSFLRYEKSTAIALTQVNRLVELIDELLDISKIESGRLNLFLEKNNIRKILENAIERLAEQEKSAKCQVRLEAPDNIFLVCDSFRLDQVITNLLTNAFKYASSKPVDVKVLQNNEDIIIQVRDYGMGIESSKLGMIFNRFERAVDSNNISGLGLGLYIARKIVEAHGGEIRVDSELGKGSTFQVRLPKQR